MLVWNVSWIFHFISSQILSVSAFLTFRPSQYPVPRYFVLVSVSMNRIAVYCGHMAVLASGSFGQSRK